MDKGAFAFAVCCAIALGSSVAQADRRGENGHRDNGRLGVPAYHRGGGGSGGNWQRGARGPRHGGHHSYRGYGGYWGPGIGLSWGGGGWWGPWYGYGVGYPYAYSSYPRYRVVEVPVRVEQQPVESGTPPTSDLWFYCTDPAGYHPYVKHCNTIWLEVLPEAAGSQSAPRLTR